MSKCFSTDKNDVGWLKNNIPCRAHCPANTDIPGYIDAIVQGEYSHSYEINRRDNIFPGILGRVCSKPCESPCRHAFPGLGEAVSICNLKRTAWDFGRFDVSKKWQKAASTGKKIAVIGAGPSGLTVANELSLWGYEVTVFERENSPGGMMTLGIPRFRLPKEVTDYDIQSVLDLGVTLKTGVAVGVDISIEELSKEYDAVVVATGTMNTMALQVPGEDGEGVYRGLDFMIGVNKGDVDAVPESVVVIGGGFTAVDCVRSSVRLGGKKVTLAYRRTQKEMWIDAHELEAMEEEGIEAHYLVSPIEIVRDDQGSLIGIKMIKNQLGDSDQSGRRRPEPIEGSEFIIETDMVIAAIGQRADDTLIDKIKGWKEERPSLLEGSNIFFAGDFRIGASSIIDAVGDAKNTAAIVHKGLGGRLLETPIVTIEDLEGPGTGRARNDDFIEKQPMPALSVEQRGSMDAEVLTGYDKNTSCIEGKRCYLCDHDYQIDMNKCIYCVACIEAMPRDCIFLAKDVKTDEQGSLSVDKAESWEQVNAVVIDNAECIRCGNCVRACPVDCISLARIRPVDQRDSQLITKIGSREIAEAAQQ